MPTFRKDIHLGHEVTLVDTDDIRNKAITEEKMDDDSVSTRTIIDKSVTEPKLDDNSVSTRTIIDENVTESKMHDDSVSTRTIIDRNVTESKMHDDSVSTRTIQNESVTEPKMHDDSVSTRTIQNKAVTEPKIDDDAVSTRTIQPEAVTHEKLHDDAVESNNIKDSEVGWQKLDDNVQNIIASAGQHGVALSNEWGNSTLIGLTQKMLSRAIGDVHKDGDDYISIQYQIDQIVNDKAEVSLAATPSPVFVGVQSNISLVATTNTEAASIKIKKGATEIASGSGLTLSGSDTITPSAAGNTTYLALFTIAGLQKQATKNVVAVYPIKYGAGQAYTDATTQASARITPVGTYSVVVPNNGDYVFFVVPATMTIHGATMSGFDFPLQAAQNVEIEGVAYKYYQSANTYDAGTLSIVIS